MTYFPENENALLTRIETARALTSAGFPTKPATLATKATRGGGPPYRSFGNRVLYRWGDALSWAENCLSAPRTNTSQVARVFPPYRQENDTRNEADQ